MEDKQGKIVIITGLSGSGKSVVLRAMEDIGYYCIDNMPILLLPDLLELEAMESTFKSNVALVMDVRMIGFDDDHEAVLRKLREKGFSPFVIFLEAANEVVIKRYKMTRREHPLTGLGDLADAIKAERKKLAGIRTNADMVIDTSTYDIHKLAHIIRKLFSDDGVTESFNVVVKSFGFGLGLPGDADIVIDVRFLPNPFFDDKLRDMTGVDRPVADFILEKEQAKDLLSYLLPFVEFLLTRFQEGRTYLNIAIGCTGGRHRSVCIANVLHNHLKAQNYNSQVFHRDL